MDVAGHRHRARGVEVEREPVGPRRRVHARTRAVATRAPRAEQPAPPQDRARSSGAIARAWLHRPAVRSGVPCPRVRALRRRGLQDGWRGWLRQQGPADDLRTFVVWLRRFFDVDETRLRMRLYLHEGPRSGCGERFWCELLTRSRRSQFRKPYRAVADPSIRRTEARHTAAQPSHTVHRTHRRVMGLIAAVSSTDCPSGVAQLAERRPVKPNVVGSSPTPGARQPSPGR